MSTDVQTDIDPTNSSAPSEPSGAEAVGSSANPSRSEPSSPSTAEQRDATGTTTNRLEKVSSKDLDDFKNSFELVWVMFGAIYAHKRLYEDAGILHGDINPNTIVMLETEDGEIEGALIDYDMPLCRAAMRKLANPDPVVGPTVRPQQFFRPAYYHY